MPSTIQRMETGIDQLLRVADVVEIRRSDKCLSIIGIELLRYAFCCARYRLSMAPSLTLRTQQIPCVLLGPVAQLHASTVGRTYDSNPGCDNFLYIIKRGVPACGRPRGRPRPCVSLWPPLILYTFLAIAVPEAARSDYVREWWEDETDRF